MKRIATMVAVLLLAAAAAGAQDVDMEVMSAQVLIDGTWKVMNVVAGETGDLLNRVADLKGYCSQFTDNRSQFMELGAVLSGESTPDQVSVGLYVLPGADGPVYLVEKTSRGIRIVSRPRITVAYYPDQSTMYLADSCPVDGPGKVRKVN